MGDILARLYGGARRCHGCNWRRDAPNQFWTFHYGVGANQRGALPPMSQEVWIAEFEKYKQIPEFEAEHPGMDLAGFRYYLLLGMGTPTVGPDCRPCLCCAIFHSSSLKRLPKGRALALTSVLFLIGIQAFLYWMVDGLFRAARGYGRGQSIQAGDASRHGLHHSGRAPLVVL